MYTLNARVTDFEQRRLCTNADGSCNVCNITCFDATTVSRYLSHFIAIIGAQFQ